MCYGRALLLIALVGCTTEPGDNPIPELTSVTPDTLAPNADSVMFTFRGHGFVWNTEVDLDTLPFTMEVEVLSSSELHARPSPSLTRNWGMHEVRVRNPSPGGGTSASLSVAVRFPVPRIDSIVPDSAVAGSFAWGGSIWGSDFGFWAAQLTADGVLLDRWSSSRTRYDVGLDSATIVTPKTIVIEVINPAPGGGSARATLRVVAPSQAR